MFRLCLALGYAHPDYLLSALTPKQLAEWFAYYKSEPFGEEMDWLKFGTIASIVAGLFRKKGSAPIKPQDFLPSCFRRGGKKQTVEEMKNILMGIVKMTGGDKE